MTKKRKNRRNLAWQAPRSQSLFDRATELIEEFDDLLGAPEFNQCSSAPIHTALTAGLVIECRQCVVCDHTGISDLGANSAACHGCDWQGAEPVEDQCPGCGKTNCMAAACPECGGRYELLASKTLPPAAGNPHPSDVGMLEQEHLSAAQTETPPGIYAVYMLDNWDGEGDTYWIIARKQDDGEWVSEESGKGLIEYEGDELLKIIPLDAAAQLTQARAAPARQ